MVFAGAVSAALVTASPTATACITFACSDATVHAASAAAKAPAVAGAAPASTAAAADIADLVLTLLRC